MNDNQKPIKKEQTEYNLVDEECQERIAIRALNYKIDAFLFTLTEEKIKIFYEYSNNFTSSIHSETRNHIVNGTELDNQTVTHFFTSVLNNKIEIIFNELLDLNQRGKFNDEKDKHDDRLNSIHSILLPNNEINTLIRILEPEARKKYDKNFNNLIQETFQSLKKIEKLHNNKQRISNLFELLDIEELYINYKPL